MSKFDELYTNAINERPEQFIRPTMPYIKCSINGIKLIALIDTGSMITCTNLEIANKCDIISEMDDRFKLEVAGVGNKTSIGKNYGVDIVINGKNIVMPITVLDISLRDCDMLIGLDLMRSFQANVDFKTNTLNLNAQSSVLQTKLLSERDLTTFHLVRQLIEISNGQVNELEAEDLLSQNNYNLDTCILKVLNS